MRTTVLIVAAGSGSRLQAGVHKAMATLGDGRTMLEHCLDSVAAAADRGTALKLNAIAVVVPAEANAAAALGEVCARFADRTSITVRTVPGGPERADSVRAGLAAVRALAGPGATEGPFERHAVLVHDAARPFVPPAVFHAVVAALESGAAAVVPAIPVVDTIKTVEAAQIVEGAQTTQAAGPVPEWVTGTPLRSDLRAVQTPQGFDLTSLEAAHRHAAEAAADGAAALTDDAMAMEAAGHGVGVVPGDPLGFKITTGLDLLLASALLDSAATANTKERPS